MFPSINAWNIIEINSLLVHSNGTAVHAVDMYRSQKLGFNMSAFFRILFCML